VEQVELLLLQEVLVLVGSRDQCTSTGGSGTANQGFAGSAGVGVTNSGMEEVVLVLKLVGTDGGGVPVIQMELLQQLLLLLVLQLQSRRRWWS
jgi:hypothetical protein